MKTLMTSTAFAILLAPAAFADQNAIVDFNGDGIISESDYIGSKEQLDNAPTVQPAQYAVRTITRTVKVPGTSDAVPVTELAPPADGNYVHIGEYKGGEYGTLEKAPATTKVVTKKYRVKIADPVVGIDSAKVIPNPHGSLQAIVPTALRSEISEPKTGADGVITWAEFRDSGLDAYDTNGDGMVTSNEAVSNLDPLLDPNVESVRDAYKGTNEIVSPESKNL